MKKLKYVLIVGLLMACTAHVNAGHGNGHGYADAYGTGYVEQGGKSNGAGTGYATHGTGVGYVLHSLGSRDGECPLKSRTHGNGH